MIFDWSRYTLDAVVSPSAYDREVVAVREVIPAVVKELPVTAIVRVVGTDELKSASIVVGEPHPPLLLTGMPRRADLAKHARRAVLGVDRDLGFDRG